LLASVHNELLDLTHKKLTTLLNTLNFVQAVIEVADAEGNITYVSPEFERITGIPCERRINQNVFKVSPNGGLAKCLRLQKEIKNHRTKIGGTEIEVVSYANPIIVNDKIQGAVVICNEMNDIYKLIDELNESRQVIKNMSTKMQAFSTSKYTFDDIIGHSDKMREAICLAKKASATDVPVLITGETGTGKELIAHSIHNASNRIAMPFVVVNCAAIPNSLLESEFFGHEKGSFTGAIRKKIGKFELADKGTIFLDEIGELDLNLQAKLLRVLQDKIIEPVGSTSSKKVDVRIILATNRDLKR
jgi:PAS domain S-box-containing protein